MTLGAAGMGRCSQRWHIFISFVFVTVGTGFGLGFDGGIMMTCLAVLSCHGDMLIMVKQGCFGVVVTGVTVGVIREMALVPVQKLSVKDFGVTCSAFWRRYFTLSRVMVALLAGKVVGPAVLLMSKNDIATRILEKDSDWFRRCIGR